MKVIYYYYYLFYTKVLPDTQPHATVIFSLSFIFSLILNGIINVILAYKFALALNRWEMIAVLAFIIFLMYLFFYNTGKGKRIVEIEKPKLFNSNGISIFISILLFIIGMMFLFFEPDITRGILNN
jgi:hypothetical protein